MRGKHIDKEKRNGALKRMKIQLKHYQSLIGKTLPSSFKIKTKGIKKNMTSSELLDLKIKRVTECIAQTEANNSK